jgi:predicted metal-dependent phosphoesterase TrpH
MLNSKKISFEKPLLNQLSLSHTVLDMHVHTRYSDGLHTPGAIAKAAARLGIGVAVTDHNAIQGAVEIDRDPGILSIPGIEITSREGSHLLVYFYDIGSLQRFYRSEVVPHMGGDVMSSLSLPMEEVMERAKSYRSVVIFPHPYCAAYTGVCNIQFPKERLNHLMNLADGVEVINAGNLNKWNLQCAVLGFNLNKGMTGGSDAHNLAHVGRAVTYLSGDVSRESFLDAVRDGRTRVIGKELNIFRKMTANSGKIKSNIRNCPDLVERNLRYGATYLNSKSKKIKENMLRTFGGKVFNQ